VGDLVPQRFPWEPVPVADTVKLLQADLAYMVTHTAVMVHSKHTELQIIVNTRRGQIVPRGECKFSDGSTFEFQDIGMPQVGAPEMTVRELMTKVLETAHALGLELT
jgi:hypothetical protein